MDEFDKEYPWMKSWFVPAATDTPGLTPEQKGILEEIATGWDREDKIALFDRLAGIHGEEVDRAMEKAVVSKVLAEWREEAGRQSANDLPTFMRLLWEPLHAKGFNFTVKKTADGLQIDCRACPMADWAKARGAGRWIYLLGCGTDPHMLAGFNPSLGFRRTRTLMQGHDRCDHTYILPSGSAEKG